MLLNSQSGSDSLCDTDERTLAFAQGDSTEFQQTETERELFFAAIREGEQAIEEGRTRSAEEVYADFESDFRKYL